METNPKINHLCLKLQDFYHLHQFQYYFFSYFFEHKYI